MILILIIMIMNNKTNDDFDRRRASEGLEDREFVSLSTT